MGRLTALTGTSTTLCARTNVIRATSWLDHRRGCVWAASHGTRRSRSAKVSQPRPSPGECLGVLGWGWLLQCAGGNFAVPPSFCAASDILVLEAPSLLYFTPYMYSKHPRSYILLPALSKDAESFFFRNPVSFSDVTTSRRCDVFGRS